MQWLTRHSRLLIFGMGTAVTIAVVVAVLPRPLSHPEPTEVPVWLSDVTDQTGITFRHTDGSSGKKYVVEYVASGFATFDYDNDGLVDIYFVNGAPLRGTSVDSPPTNRLYRNLGGFRFRDCTREAGVGGSLRARRSWS